ncbi:MAG: hypothetical protein FD125_2910 [bacterium]|nr:MAG: hypothetical protein FD125_2910 [bacterium]
MIDFGDVQIFEGVTTYPAILTLRKGDSGDGGQLRFLAVTDKAPEDIGREFARRSTSMPRARLGKGSWQFEDDALAALRAKITGGRKALGEVYGAPLYGIKTGLNEAFVIDRATRDRLVGADPKSADLLKPFLRGENIKRWRIESDDLFLINTPRGQVDIEAYPAVRDWLLRSKDALEKRATKQGWWELQQAQLAYQPFFSKRRFVWPDISPEARVAWDDSSSFLDCTAFFVATDDEWPVAFLNSSLAWFFWRTLTPDVRGGFARLKAQFVSQTPLPELTPPVAAALQTLATEATAHATKRRHIITEAGRRILDLAPPDRRKLTRKLEAWHDLDFTAFRAEVKATFKTEIPLRERGEWEAYLSENAAEVHRLSAEIAAAEREIDAIVYRLFELTPEEIALLESAIAGQH